MKRLADIRRGIVKHYGLSLADVALAVIAFFGKYLRNKRLRIISARNIKIEISAYGLYSSYFGKRQLFGKLGRYRHRTFMKRTTQFEARKRNIAHRAVGRIFEHCKDIVLRKTYSTAERSYRFSYRSGNKFFDFCHTYFSLHNFRANTINPFYHKLYYTILFSFLQQEIE